MSSEDASPANQPMDTLRDLVLKGVVVRMVADFTPRGFVVTITTSTEDELRAARLKRLLMTILEPVLPEVIVVIKPDEGG